MTAPVWRGRVIVASALILLGALCVPVALYGLAQALARPYAAGSYAWVLPVLAYPFYALGAWRGYPSAASARWTLAGAHAALALFCAGLGVAILVIQGPFGRNPVPGEGLALMAAMFLLPAALFAGVAWLVGFSPSVREFWGRRDAPR